ncbi:MAG: DUF4416 family protein [Candidatus Omnitrophica bacterium]|nr:DUF4416 family protein [Candidatus Omnitrophota bacterium]MDD5591711.1 DUF4416 family protein [Candidatus Omnitrophota bacterium]
MGKIKKHLAVKLFSGFIFKEENTLAKAESFLEKKFGRIDFESPLLPFTHTHYYEEEFGKGLKRKFVSFKKLIPPEGLPKIKIATNRIEQKLSRAGLRLINIDPGYLDMAKLVLATTKDYKHRIYLDKGIYAEITLFYEHKDFKAWEWTYPDYKTADYIAVFNRIREIYAAQIKNKCIPSI